MERFVIEENHCFSNHFLVYLFLGIFLRTQKLHLLRMFAFYVSRAKISRNVSSEKGYIFFGLERPFSDFRLNLFQLQNWIPRHFGSFCAEKKSTKETFGFMAFQDSEQKHSDRIVQTET